MLGKLKIDNHENKIVTNIVEEMWSLLDNSRDIYTKLRP